ncbi:efflux RND transporter periplasmic adaptor subunit [Psychromonas sp. KJ10-10]|uniref:efflux RND transporter periplasmic adaptor subunit n=1 Tax=Psychromonas sp. KJ10-10 TaxID=3391823 RepID=UPI0039B5118B
MSHQLHRRFSYVVFNILVFSLLVSTFFSNQLIADTLFEVKKENKQRLLTLDATLEAINKATLSSQTNGRIIKINFDTNDYVNQGEVLLEITNKEQGAQLAKQVKQNYYARKQIIMRLILLIHVINNCFLKVQFLKDNLMLAETSVKTSQQQIKAAEANLIQAKESLNYTIVRAPFSGVVTERHVEVGESVNLGQPLFSGMSLDKLRAVTEIPQRYIEALHKDPSFIITLTNGSQLFSDKITLFNYADQQSHAFKVRIELPENNLQLLPGMWVKTQFVTGTREKILIPNSAILINNELTAVYRQVQDNVVLTQIRLGNKSEGFTEVLAGLQDGDNIILDAYAKLQSLGTKQ